MSYHFKILPIFRVKLENKNTYTPLEGEETRLAKFCLSHKGEFVLSLKKPTKRNSPKQRGYYWGLVLPMIADEIGEPDLDEVHNLMKSQFLRQRSEIKGKMYTKIGRTSTLSTDAFAEYIEKVRDFASRELSVYIPNPDKHWYVRELQREVSEM